MWQKQAINCSKAAAKSLRATPPLFSLAHNRNVRARITLIIVHLTSRSDLFSIIEIAASRCLSSRPSSSAALVESACASTRNYSFEPRRELGKNHSRCIPRQSALHSRPFTATISTSLPPSLPPSFVISARAWAPRTKGQAQFQSGESYLDNALEYFVARDPSPSRSVPFIRSAKINV